MRTIKFRAFVETLDGKEMVYDWCFLNAEDKHFYAVDLTNERTDIGYVYSIMQFTGLHDRNGKEIYEGDFLISPFTGDPAPVIYDQEYCQFTFGGAEFNVEVKHKKLEVIGNIYENPELL